MVPPGALGFTSNSNWERKKHTSNSMKKFICPKMRDTAIDKSHPHNLLLTITERQGQSR